LGLRSLHEHCQRRLGDAADRVRLYTLAEVQAANAAGRCVLILDGMVLDVTRWLPEHPGGSSIIPAQALNLDCATFFEVQGSP
jgi:cytochrome b involved in lipid metabolism